MTYGSRIEGNRGVNDPQNLVYLDISYVTGFSIPIVCSCGTSVSGTPVTGCNKALLSLNQCPAPQLLGNPNTGTCINLAPDNGPPTTFFAPCQGAAFTYADDTGAIGTCAVNNIACCLGAMCSPVARQPSGAVWKLETGVGGMNDTWS